MLVLMLKAHEQIVMATADGPVTIVISPKDPVDRIMLAFDLPDTVQVYREPRKAPRSTG